MGKCKLIFCDIDGTLLTSEHRVSIGTAKKIRSLREKGIPFVPVSARMPSGILPIMESIGISGPIVCYGGALILDETGKALSSIAIGRAEAESFAGEAIERWPKACLSAYAFDRWFVADDSDPGVLRENRITGAVPVITPDALPPDGGVHKFLCICPPDEIADMERALAARYPHLSVFQSTSTYIEVMRCEANKARAVEAICGHLGIAAGEAISFGDNRNDLSMLGATGIGVAMGNASEEVKRASTHTTLDNDHEGILVFLNRMEEEGLLCVV